MNNQQKSIFTISIFRISHSESHISHKKPINTNLAFKHPFKFSTGYTKAVIPTVAFPLKSLNRLHTFPYCLGSILYPEGLE